MKYILICDCILETVGDETILIPKHDGKIDITKCVYLEGIGGKIWELLQNGLSIEEIEEILLKKYIVEKEELRRDMDEFFETLIEARIVRLKDGE